MHRKVSGRPSGIAFIFGAGCEDTTVPGGMRINYSNDPQPRAAHRPDRECARRPKTASSDKLCAVPNAAELRKTTRRNTAPWLGLLLAVCAIGCNAGFFLSIPWQGAIAWLSLLLGAMALIFLAVGLWRAYGQARVYGGKVLSVVLAIIAMFPVGLSAVGFVVTRKLPSAAAAPQVGQKVPDFTLPDTAGQPMSLDQLFAPASSGSQPPKAVLLIFYRGYW